MCDFLKRTKCMSYTCRELRNIDKSNTTFASTREIYYCKESISDQKIKSFHFVFMVRWTINGSRVVTRKYRAPNTWNNSTVIDFIKSYIEFISFLRGCVYERSEYSDQSVGIWVKIYTCQRISELLFHYADRPQGQII